MDENLRHIAIVSCA